MSYVSLKDVGKFYMRQDSRLLTYGFKRLGALVQRFRRKKMDIPSFWVLEDINLEISGGSIVGILGESGCGKTTLLQLIARMVPPTRGEIHLSSHPFSFFEQKMFFQREFSVKEFIFFHGAMQGISKKIIQQNLDKIFEFAELVYDKGQLLFDYSKQELLKLIFAVLVTLDPEIVIIDDILDSLDLDFRNKAMNKLRSLSAKGSIVLLVASNVHTIRELCSRCLLLRESRVIADGDVEEVIAQFQKPVLPTRKISLGSKHKPIKILTLSLNDKNLKELNMVPTNTSFLVGMRFAVFKPGGCTYGFRLQCGNAELLYTFQPDNAPYLHVEKPGLFEVFCEMPDSILANKNYMVKSFLIWHDLESTEKILDVNQLSFHTLPDPYYEQIRQYTINNASYPGLIAPAVTWQPLKELEPTDSELSDFSEDTCI